MIVTLLLLGLALAPSLQASEEMPSFSGAYAEDLVWSGAVTMAGDVLILPAGSLTILAGTQVNVVPAEGTKIDPEYLSSQTELLVRGRLDILGTAAQPVTFNVIVDSDTEEIAWAGITLDEAGQSRILYTDLERADIGIRCVSSSPEIIGNRISSCRYGIVAQQKSHPKILENRITDGEGGVFCWNGSNPYLLGNHISGHDEEAVFVDANSRPWLDRNTVKGNAIGLALYPRDLPYDPIAVSDNIEDIRFLGSQGQGGAE